MSNKCDVVIIGAGPTGLMVGLWMSRLGVKTHIIDKRGSAVYVGHADGFMPRLLEVLDMFGLSDRIIRDSTTLYGMSIWAPSEGRRLARVDQQVNIYVDQSTKFAPCTTTQAHVEQAFLDSMKEYGGVTVERGVLPVDIKIDDTKLNDEAAYPVTVTLKHLKKEAAPHFQMKAHIKDEEGNLLQRSGPQTTEHASQRSNSGAEVVDGPEDPKDREGDEEVIHAKYVVGCDGARSWTRGQLGFKLEGEDTDAVFGVLDIVPITTFPDIRKPCIIQTDAGSMLIIPRENAMCRIYAQLAEVKVLDGHFANRKSIGPSNILENARKILSPYTLDYRYCDWWTVYQIGQRICNRYVDDSGRIFVAGDAAHTHSPKGGQGMNLGIMDGFNLGWKLGGVVKGYLHPDVLSTYEPERRTIARQVIELDHRQAALYTTSKPDPDEVLAVYDANSGFSFGLTTRYYPSLVMSQDTSDSTKTWNNDRHSQLLANVVPPPPPAKAKVTTATQSVAPGLTIGMRVPPIKLSNHASSVPIDLPSLMRPDGRWRLLLFAGNVTNKAQLARVNAIGEALSDSKNGLLVKYQAKPAIQLPELTDIPEFGSRDKRFFVGEVHEKIPIIDVLTIHSSGCAAIESDQFHSALFPFDKYAGYNYEKILADEYRKPNSIGQSYKKYGIDLEKGCMILVRPDQHIAWMGESTPDKGLESLGVFVKGVFTEA